MQEFSRPLITVAVTMRKERLSGLAARWFDWRWKLHDVVVDDGNFGDAPRLLHHDDQGVHWLFPAMKVELYRDDAEGYYLNATTAQPAWFVMWRMEEELGLSDELIAVPQVVSLSYHDAGRWLDAQETVEQWPCPPDVAQWMAQFTQDHYVAEPKKRKRPESFKRLEDRFGNPVSISAGQKYGGLDGAA
jgi:Protein of unknown function (DUF3305)